MQIRDERGSLAVEAVLVIPIILVVLVAVAEMFLVAVTRLEMEAATREGARVAATHPDPGRAVAAVKGALSPGLANRVRVAVTAASVVGAAVKVEVSMRYRPATPILDRIVLTLHSRSVMQREG
jgi:Flp pilus assembly protein TadG